MDARQHKAGANGVFVVVAAYNEAAVIENTVREVLAAYSRVVVVDDGSTDDTSSVVSGLPVHIIRHSINRGQGAALQTGITYALTEGAEIIVAFDADGQHCITDIPKLLAPIRNDRADLVLGSRFLGTTEGIPLTRRLTLHLGVLFTRIVSRIHVTDTHNGLRAFSRPVAEQLTITMDRMAHASEILDHIRKNGWRYCEVPVTILYTDYSMAKGQSSWNAIRIVTQVLLEKLGI